MLKLLSKERLYICLDEFSDIDKIEPTLKYSIQSQVAQLIKQTFFKSPYYSVKIASIWNTTKLHDKSINNSRGIEYKEDIFDGPDLDIMFLFDNQGAIDFFQRIIVNTYLLSTSKPDAEKKLLAKDPPISNFEKDLLMTDIIDDVFGKDTFRHLVCGSQGVARAFAALALDYIRKREEKNFEKLSYDEVFQLIIHQYLDNVRHKIPYSLDIPQAINEHITTHDMRYFLISKKDYKRCKAVIKFLASSNYFMQLPEHKTDRRLRDNYKLCLVNYGNFLDARQMKMNTLSQDSSLIRNGILFPKIDTRLLNNPDDYCVNLPLGSEKQYYCAKCNSEVYLDSEFLCPNCNSTIQSYMSLQPLEEVLGLK